MNKKKVMSENDYQLFRALAELTQEQLRNLLFAHLKRKYKKIIATEDYIYAVGDVPIGLLAHMDTVFNAPPEEIYYDTRQNVIWSPQGLGADDRAGVFAILKILQQTKLLPSVIFTTNEEIGGVGAFQLADKIDKPLSDLKFLIQLDRRGSEDCVFYDCDNREFVKFIESYGFKENFGSFTDISVLCPVWEIAGVNLSIGYVREHSIAEVLHVDHMYDTISKVENILKTKDLKKFIYVENVTLMNKWYKQNVPYSYPGWDDEEDWYDTYGKMGSHKLTSTTYKCHFCNGIFYENEIVPLEIYGEKEPKIVCAECCIDHVAWCPRCDLAFDKTKYDECPACGYKFVKEGKPNG